MTRLILDNLVKSFDGVAVVDRATLEVRPGALAIVVGPSGGGKTVLARLVAGLERLDDGEIYLDGRLIHGLPAGHRGVGFLGQGDALWPHLTVAEAIAYPLVARRVPRRERQARVAEALATARLESVARRYPETLSPLQRRRVGLAAALVARPEVLVLDDPLGPVPGRDRAELRDAIRRVVTETGLTTLMTGSDPREALALADQVAVMDLGKILQAGDPSTAYNRPVDPFVARYLGDTNLIQGQVDSLDARGDVVVRTPLGRLVGRTEAAGLAPGSPVTLSIRPEALGLGAAAPHGSNRFPATVERLVFLGEVRQVHLRGVGDWPVVALALQPQSTQLREGQPLSVHVAPEQVVVLPTRHAPPEVEAVLG